MANNYLRYKYYLITRAAADEIYTAVQEIFMKMGVKPGAETAPSQKAAIHFTNAEEMKINASVAELLKHGALISLKGGATGDMKVSDSTGEEARIGTAFDLLSEMKLNSAHSSAIDEKNSVLPCCNGKGDEKNVLSGHPRSLRYRIRTYI